MSNAKQGPVVGTFLLAFGVGSGLLALGAMLSRNPEPATPSQPEPPVPVEPVPDPQPSQSPPLAPTAAPEPGASAPGAQEGSGAAAPSIAIGEPSPIAPIRYDPPLAQADIVKAIELAITGGDLTPLATIGRVIERQPPEIRAYVAAAGRRAKAYHAEVASFTKTFGADAKIVAQKVASDTASGLQVAGAVAGVVNVIPVVGQVISAILAVGIAVTSALLQGFKLPVRKAEDQILPAYEGRSVYRGIGVTPTEDPYEDIFLTLKQQVIQDPIAFSLPVVPTKTAFLWAPQLADFVAVAHEMKLYPWDLPDEES